jgi:hypothetical protein
MGGDMNFSRLLKIGPVVATAAILSLQTYNTLQIWEMQDDVLEIRSRSAVLLEERTYAFADRTIPERLTSISSRINQIGSEVASTSSEVSSLSSKLGALERDMTHLNLMVSMRR